MDDYIRSDIGNNPIVASNLLIKLFESESILTICELIDEKTTINYFKTILENDGISTKNFYELKLSMSDDDIDKIKHQSIPNTNIHNYYYH